MIENEKFNKCVEAYKKLSTNKKEDEIIKELIDLFSFINKLRQDIGIPNNVLYNKELDDLQKENRTYEDFLEATFVYVCSLKEYVAEYVDKISEIIYKEEN